MENDFSPGYPLGIIAAQSISQPLTQNTLSSFHKTGAISDIVETVPRFKELTLLTDNNESSLSFIYLIKNFDLKNIYSTFVYYNFENIIKNIRIFDINDNNVNNSIYWFKNINIKYKRVIVVEVKIYTI